MHGNAMTERGIPPYHGPVGFGVGGLLALSYLLGTFPTALIVARHTGNLVRLARGDEPALEQSGTGTP